MKLTDEEYETIVRCVMYHDYKWPKELYSGIMFFEGQRITIMQFASVAKKIKGVLGD